MTTYLQRLTTCVLSELQDTASSTWHYTIAWRSGAHFQGTLQVTVAGHWSDSRVVAELAAIQYLLEDMAVTGSEQTGKGLLLVVSQGAIKKLIANRSCKHHLYPWAMFLTTRFAGAACAVDGACRWMSPRATLRMQSITVDAPKCPEINILGFGPVAITKHVYERIARHLNYPPPDTLWLTLTRILTSQSLTPRAVDRYKQERDKFWHGRAAQRFYDPKTKWVVMIISEGEQKILVTAYLSIRQRLGWDETHLMYMSTQREPTAKNRYMDQQQLSLFAGRGAVCREQN